MRIAVASCRGETTEWTREERRNPRRLRRRAGTAAAPGRRVGRFRSVALSPPPPAEVDVLDLGRDFGVGLFDRVVVAALRLFVDAQCWRFVKETVMFEQGGGAQV